ncbi:amino acid/polyamine transporter I [Apodospora peruviana]|uniref:Amino acid/polyamine transporter I n=1 Tax=Apodospora peruviana TaxID=516989 RepID=A0AAE0MEY8_9PEZI|nr:amino acid/polyamine transporter I [Apodospora peruviana]
MSSSNSKDYAGRDHFNVKVSYDHLNDRSSSLDDVQLQRLGYQPKLSRTFGFMSMLGFSCSVVLSWESSLTNMVATLQNGGPAGVIYSFLVSWVCMLSVYSVLGELASAAPTAGGQYYWVAWLAPKRYRKFLAYETAWLTNLAWQAAFIATTYSVAIIIQGVVKLNNPSSYNAKTWHTVLIQWAVAVVAILINCTTGRTLALLEGFILILHLAGFFAILVPLVYLSPHNTASSVFTTFINDGGWSTQTLSFFVGFPAISTALCSADCAVHMSEEIQDAARVVPRALVYSAIMDGVLALGMIIATLFCIVDLDGAIAAQSEIFCAFLEIFRVGLRSSQGAVAMGCIIVVLGISSVVGICASASRLMWSLARDRGCLGDKHLVKLNRNQLPIATILTTLGICMLMSLIVLGSTVVLMNLVSLIISALYSSYLLACGLLLWRRCTGGLQPYVPGGGGDMLAPSQLSWGPWRVPEPFGTANNIVACLYCILLLFWSFWPGQPNPAPEAANWSIVVYAGVVLLSVIWYIWRAKHYFQGPMI